VGIVDGSFCSFPSLLLASSFLLILVFPSPVSLIHPRCRQFDSLCHRCRWALVAVLVVWPPHLLIIFHLLHLVYLLLVMSPFIGMSFSPSSRASPPRHLPSSSSCSSSHAIVAATAAAIVAAADIVDAAVITAAAPFLLPPPSSLLFQILVAVVEPVLAIVECFLPLSNLCAVVEPSFLCRNWSSECRSVVTVSGCHLVLWGR